jgi:hypothetical protein
MGIREIETSFLDDHGSLWVLNRLSIRNLSTNVERMLTDNETG